MIDLKSVRDRVGKIELFLSVKDTISAAEAMESFNALPPAAFVSTAGERAESNKMSTGRHRQRVYQTISILFALALERADDERSDPAEEARQAILEALIAWSPAGADGPFEYVSYSVIQMGQGLMWGEVLCRAPWHLVKDA